MSPFDDNFKWKNKKIMRSFPALNQHSLLAPAQHPRSIISNEVCHVHVEVEL